MRSLRSFGSRGERPEGSDSTAELTERPSLIVDEGGGARRTVRLARDVTTLGRKNDNDIQLLTDHVSKYHAEIRRRDEEFVIVDVGSKAGVLVNGLRVNERTLGDGDVITFGYKSPPEMVFSRNGAPVPSHAATSVLETVSMGPEGHGLEKLARFMEFSRLLGGRVRLNEILENVVNLAIEVTGAERGFLILKGKDGKEGGETEADGALDYRVARGKGKLPLPEEEIRASETIVRDVLAKGEARVVSDVRMEEGLAEEWSVEFFALRSAIALPLRRLSLAEGETPGADEAGEQKDVFGVLYLDSHETRESFTRIDRDILESLARDASSAIENGRLLRQAEEKRWLEQEMERAREIQTALLPESLWEEPHFQVDGYCVPSRRLGGDYLDQFRLPDGRCCLVIADVSGKGMPAALLAAALHGILAAEALRDQPLGTMVEGVNRALCRRVPLGKYVTFFCCALSPTGELSWVNGGHVPPILIRQGGETVKLFTGDMALGIQDSSTYQVCSLTVSPGDVIALYTDGVTEAVDPEGEFFEEARLEKVLDSARHLPAAGIVKAVTEEVETFTHKAPPRDDITLLVLKCADAGSGGEGRTG